MYLRKLFPRLEEVRGDEQGPDLTSSFLLRFEIHVGKKSRKISLKIVIFHSI